MTASRLTSYNATTKPLKLQMKPLTTLGRPLRITTPQTVLPRIQKLGLAKNSHKAFWIRIPRAPTQTFMTVPAIIDLLCGSEILDKLGYISKGSPKTQRTGIEDATNAATECAPTSLPTNPSNQLSLSYIAGLPIPRWPLSTLIPLGRSHVWMCWIATHFSMVSWTLSQP